jgi:hypothetical protein
MNQRISSLVHLPGRNFSSKLRMSPWREAAEDEFGCANRFVRVQKAQCSTY